MLAKGGAVSRLGSTEVAPCLREMKVGVKWRQNTRIQLQEITAFCSRHNTTMCFPVLSSQYFFPSTTADEKTRHTLCRRQFLERDVQYKDMMGRWELNRKIQHKTRMRVLPRVKPFATPSALAALTAMDFLSLARRSFASFEAFSLFSRDSI